MTLKGAYESNGKKFLKGIYDLHYLTLHFIFLFFFGVRQIHP